MNQAEKEHQPATTTMQIVYELNGITCVPHYKENFYVSPGYGLKNLAMFSAEQLIGMGAIAKKMPLWEKCKKKAGE